MEFYDEYVRKSIRKDVDYLAPRLRPGDRREIHAATGKRGQEYTSLLTGFESSDICCTFITPDKEPAGIFGVCAPTNRWGRVWMFGTRSVERWPILFLKRTRVWVDLLNIMYPLLYNVVDTRNTAHIKWLKWCGFGFINTTTHNDVDFKFFMRGGNTPNV